MNLHSLAKSRIAGANRRVPGGAGRRIGPALLAAAMPGLVLLPAAEAATPGEAGDKPAAAAATEAQAPAESAPPVTAAAPIDATTEREEIPEADSAAVGTLKTVLYVAAGLGLLMMVVGLLRNRRRGD